MGRKITHLSFLRFLFYYTLSYVFYHLHVISDWFSSIFSAASQIQNYRNRKLIKGQFLQITLPQKPFMVLYTNGHISKSIVHNGKLDISSKLTSTFISVYIIILFYQSPSPSSLHIRLYENSLHQYNPESLLAPFGCRLFKFKYHLLLHSTRASQVLGISVSTLLPKHRECHWNCVCWLFLFFRHIYGHICHIF